MAYSLSYSASAKSGFSLKDKYKLIDENELEVLDAVRMLGTAETLAVDCEGMDMSRYGKLTLLSIATNDQAYLFDILKLGKMAFESGLKSLLENGFQTKLMFDCRGDSDALYHQFGVKLSGVLDLQIMEVLYREKIGEFDIANKEARLARFGRAEQPVNLHGLRKCLESYVHDSSYIAAKRGIPPSMINKVWIQRPLSETLLAYAATDVLSLFPLFDFFNQKLSGNSMSRLKESSDVYLNIMRELPFYHGNDDKLVRSQYFPVHVLPGKNGLRSFRAENTDWCSGCKRMLPSFFFSFHRGRGGQQFCPIL